MGYRLILDFGNTLKKAAVYENERQLVMRSTSGDIVSLTEQLKEEFPHVEAAILSTVVKIDVHLLHYLKTNFKFLLFDHQTPIPLTNKYLTPQTLGRDRLAASIGAYSLFAGENMLVIDAGSSITYDIVSSSGEYLGGAISAGIKMRAKALNQFTDMLPLVETPTDVELLGNDTQTCLQSGIVNGTIAEVNGMIEKYREQFEDLKIILTGGDLNYFEKSLKYNIFASANLVLQGLNHILDFNEL